jgi:acetyltransferase-like isoleucine patch superfamily enzyme
MTAASALCTKIAEQIMRRRVQLDPNIPISALIRIVTALGIGLVRGLLLTRRILVLERGARISNLGRFSSSGGLVRLGAHSRVECDSREGVKVGRNFKLGAFSRVVASGSYNDLGQGITVGDNVGISEFAYIGGAGGLRIGSDVIIGQYFSTHPENHVYRDTQRLVREQGVTRVGIEIGQDCWIGAKVTLLDGVTLGRGCVVAAGSVVNRSFPDFAIIGGVPAKLLGVRESFPKRPTMDGTEELSDD